MQEIEWLVPAPQLSSDYVSRAPVPDDLEALVALVDRRRALTPGRGPFDPKVVTTEVVGLGSWTRRQVVVQDATGQLVGWATLHDRAAGRTDLRVVVDPDADEPDRLAAALFDWTEVIGMEIAVQRGVAETRLELLLDQDDEQLRGWAEAAGHRLARTWLNMSRRVDVGETQAHLRPGVVVRRVRTHDLGDGTNMPVAEDLQIVHRMLEESFEDHFNSYRESFPEFTQRLREDPGHRWDHWWLALIEEPATHEAEGESDGEPVLVPGGALVSTLSPPDDGGVAGSYVDYIGVHRRARGRGVAKALLLTVIADAAERGRNRVGLEVDADSPTGADGLYLAMGWETSYVTQSWHRNLVVPSAITVSTTVYG